MNTWSRLACCGVAAMTAASPALAREVRVPLRLDAALLDEVVRREVYTGPGGTAVVWDDRKCSRLVLASPAVALAAGQVRLETEADGSAGTPAGEWCVFPLRYQGSVELDLSPWIDAERSAVRFRVVDSRTRARRASWPLRSETVMGWVRAHAHARFEESFAVDLRPALRELDAVLPLFLVSDGPPLRPVALDEVMVTDEAVLAWLRVEVDAPPRSAPLPPEPALSPEERERWLEAQQRWDGFVTFVTREAAGLTPDPELRGELLSILLDARHELVDAAASEAGTEAESDPVRSSFLRTWERLAPVLRRIEPGAPGESLRWLAFIAAGDALRAIDALGPGTELDVSADGLRRLARVLLAVDSTIDPLAYDESVDPVLRRSFGFGEPLELPPPEPAPDEGADPDREIEPAQPGSSLRPGVLRASLAAGAAAASADGGRLRGWVPARGELGEYLPLVRELLRKSGERALETRPLAPELGSLFRSALLATAWQESCWRHWVRRRGKVAVIRSSAGALGIMQVNPRVWRGFYDVGGLEREIAYNSGAGAEILLHYLIDHALRKGEHTVTRSTESLARSSYAMYNGGPRQLRRYRRATATARERAVDEGFLEKYRATAAGRELDVALCFPGGGAGLEGTPRARG
jgi:hypothetical protein